MYPYGRCRLGHEHGTLTARRGCDAFNRAFARYERREVALPRPAWSDERAFALWMQASRLVNSLFSIAMSDVVAPARESRATPDIT